MDADLSLEPTLDVWYGLTDASEWFEEEIETDEPEYEEWRHRGMVIRVSDYR